MHDKMPEQLLSEALRAKAVQAPSQSAADAAAQDEPAKVADPEPADASGGAPELLVGTEPEFELLSGRDYALSPQPVHQAAAPEPPTATRSGPRPLSTRWILLLAILLGAAAGAIAALLTLG